MTEQDTLLPLDSVSDITYREWHAFIEGVYDGLNDEHDHQYDQERHWWKAGWVVGDTYRYYR